MGSNSEWVCLEIISEGAGDEEYSATHPFDRVSFVFSEMQKVIDEYRNKYPQFEEFKFEYCWKSHGYGAETNWWELQGLATTELQKELYKK